MEKTFYVYIDKRPSGEIFYVGKGNARRIKQEKRNRYHTFITKKYPDWTRDIVFVGAEKDCLAEEKRLIDLLGRINLGTGLLVNLCDGGLGAANYVMSQNEKDRLSKNWSGEKNPLFNQTIYNWVNLDTGEKKSSTIFDMHLQNKGCRAHWTSVVNGDRKSHVGWSLQTTKINVRSSKGKLYKFEHESGDIFSGTQKDLTDKTGMSCASASRIVHKNYKTLGWYVKK